MRYDQIQNAVTVRLATTLAGVFPPAAPATAARVQVIDQPATEAANVQAYAVPRVVVSYVGSDFESPQATDEISQHETVQIEVLVNSSELYGSAHTVGAHQLITAVRASLLGFKPADCDRLKLDSIALVSLDKGVFVFLMKFSAMRLAVEEFEPLNVPLITQITLNNPISIITIQ